MTAEKKTHREVKKPKISARHLADYMAASEQARRTIVRGCKYQPIARLVQHDEAKLEISRFIRNGSDDVEGLIEAAQRLRDRIADDDFERNQYDTNADYIDQFRKVAPKLELPNAEILAPGSATALELNGTKVTLELHFRMRRLTKTNKVRIGGGMLRYAKGKALSEEIAFWQAAFLHGYLGLSPPDEATSPEHKLCLTIDAHAGKAYPAPGDAGRRFLNMQAACATIAERWPMIEPPASAIL